MARKRRFIPSNPFADVKLTAPTTTERQYFIERATVNRILERAGVEPWPRLFHNLRASRETELAGEFPIHVVTAWLGNTPKIAMKHYLQVTDADFERAAVGGAKSGAWAVQNAVQPLSADIRHNAQNPTQPQGQQALRRIAANTSKLRPNPLNGEEGIRTPGGPYQPSPV